MIRSLLPKLALPALLLAGTTVGCAPGMGRGHADAIGGHAPRAVRPDARASARLAGETARLLAHGRVAPATARAEQAVALAPDAADRRALLGHIYLAGGRFLSAEAALQDAVRLDPAGGGAWRDLALARIALGEWQAARDTLAEAAGRMAEADRGLGYALAGQPDVAIALLEPIVRGPRADARTRQNLAFSYALAGRWDEARTVAAQDMAPAAVDARLAEWATLAQPRAVWQQVGALLHVTPARDPGMPARLALGGDGARSLAMAVIPQPTPIPAAGPPAAFSGVATAMTPAADATPPPPQAIVPATTPAATPAVPPTDASDDGAAASGAIFHAPPRPGRDAPLLHAVRTPVAAPWLVRRPARFQAASVQRAQGGWAVQLGAFAAPEAMAAKWARMRGRMTLLAAYTPARSRRAAFTRLAVSGFATRAAATALCVRIRAQRGACFVRPADGEEAGMPATQIAMR